ncbi:MAG: type II toxin-antitoxin system HipA family toxin [Verrucomicrobiota bacterium]
MKTLAVYFHGIRTGTLSQDISGKIAFQYDREWLLGTGAHPISVSLPLRAEAFSETECIGFFGGLLPEENIRILIAKNLGITPRNDYAMLREIGGECAGAISLVDPETEPAPREHAYHRISLSELETTLDTLPTRPLLAGEAEIRLSLAGAQNKLSIYHDGQGYAIPLHESPSTHILKPQSEVFPGLIDNENYCMRLAREAGLPCAQTQIETVGSHSCLLIKRYDRKGEGDNLERLHQEDFCQALGISSRYKYQAEGGPSLAQCFELVRTSSARPAKDLVILFEAVLLNYLIGNNDAHGKNFSLLYSVSGTERHVQLAPLYDLVSTAYYRELSPKMAMKIGSKYLPNDLRLRHWEAYWQAIGFSGKQALQRTRKFLERMDSILDVSPRSTVEEAIQSVIKTRMARLRQNMRQA